MKNNTVPSIIIATSIIIGSLIIKNSIQDTIKEEMRHLNFPSSIKVKMDGSVPIYYSGSNGLTVNLTQRSSGKNQTPIKVEIVK